MPYPVLLAAAKSRVLRTCLFTQNCAPSYFSVGFPLIVIDGSTPDTAIVEFWNSCGSDDDRLHGWPRGESPGCRICQTAAVGGLYRLVPRLTFPSLVGSCCP